MTSEFSVAIHALVFLNHKNITVSSELLAKNVCTNPARIRKVMGKLKKAGIVMTKEGLDGGYHMGKPASVILLSMIADVLDVEFVSASWKSGDQEKSCLISSGMGDVMDGIYQDLNQLCKNRLESITIADVEKQIFLDT